VSAIAQPSQPPADDGDALIARLRELPGAAELIALAEARGGVELVGGAVRDLLLGRVPRELDAVVAGGVEDLASELANALGGRATVHERFGTAEVRAEGIAVDLASMRAETYPAPGELPEVRPGTPVEDLHRRDFTVNAIALPLAGERRGELRSVEGALEDLAARRLRVLHERSFLDDPTRILRLVRYAVRLSFSVEPHTAELAGSALASGALDSVSGARLGSELRLAFAEPCAVEILAELDRLGVFAAWEAGVGFDEHIARAALELLPADASRRLLLAASLLLGLAYKLDEEDAEPAMRGFIYDMELPSGEGDRVFGAAVSAAVVADGVGSVATTADILDLMYRAPVESLALAVAVRDLEDGPDSYGRRTIERWLNTMRHVELEVGGEDLIAAGVPEGPEVGARLEEAYRLLLEEAIEPGRESELRAALGVQL